MELRTAFLREFSSPAQILIRAPGRINLLGEHVDYNDGMVLPAAINRAVYLAAAPTSDGIVHLYALDLGQRAAFRLEDLGEKIGLDGQLLPTWALYPASVAWALKEAGFEAGGLQAVYHSDIPIGSGLSSSAAVEVGFAVLWEALSGWQVDRMNLARLCQRGENVYVGVSCGLMDQFACANGVAGHALYLDTRSLEWEPLPLPSGTALVIADSGVRRSLTSSAYNERRASCEQAVKLLQQFMPQIQALRDVSLTEFAAYSDKLPALIRRRAAHVVREIGRVQSAVNALRRNDGNAFGALMFAGHASLRDLYEVSIPELDTLVESARKLPGCLGSRLTGAGFGGCTINLVVESQASEFIQDLKDIYLKASGREIQVYLCQASQGASVEG